MNVVYDDVGSFRFFHLRPPRQHERVATAEWPTPPRHRDKWVVAYTTGVACITREGGSPTYYYMEPTREDGTGTDWWAEGIYFDTRADAEVAAAKRALLG